MKRVLSLVLAFLLVISLTAIPQEILAASGKPADSRSGVVRILSIYYSEGAYATGSGLAVGEEGQPSNIFVTNYHVVEDADEVYILLDNDWDLSVYAFGGTDDGVHAVKCQVISDGPQDFAILRAERVIDERVALPLMLSHQADPGDRIYALGYPGVSDAVTADLTADIDSMTITSGTISRFVNYEYQHSQAIQIDADINHGNSGGPLITEEGFVIGLNTWGVGNEDGTVNLALEIDYVIDRLQELISSGTLSGFSFTLITDRPEAQAEPQGTAPAGGTQEAPASKGTNILLWVAIGIGVAALIAVFVLKASIDKIRQRTMSRRAMAMPDPTPDTKPEPKDPEIPQVCATVPQKPVVTPQAPGDNGDIQLTPKVPPVRNVAPAFVLVGVSGQFAGRRLTLSKDMRMGRSQGCDIQFPANVPGISGNHCLISPRENGIVLMDLGSTYGTLMPNGTKLTPNQKYQLKAGDMFCLGTKDQLFRLEAIGAAPAVSVEAVTPTGAPYFRLKAVDGHFAGNTMHLTKAVRIGRSQGCDIQYPADVAGISSNHCMLTPTAEGVVLTDLGSTYGTFLPNGTKLAPNQNHLLKRGDGFCLANAKQRFVIE